MHDRLSKDGAERRSKRRSHARPDRVIEKRPKWQDYLDPEEDPGLLDEDELLDDRERENWAESDESDEEEAEEGSSGHEIGRLGVGKKEKRPRER